MTTATEETPTAAAKKPGFDFDSTGNCTNPEKVQVRCALGAACALLVARDGHNWLAGYQCGGRNLAYTTVAPNQWSAHTRATRDEALKVARDGVFGYLQGLTVPAALAITKALTKEFGVCGTPETAPECPATAEKDSSAVATGAGPAFGGNAAGCVVEFPSREDAEEYVKEQSGREGFAGYATQIRKRGSTFNVSYTRAGEKEVVPEGEDSPAEQPAAIAAEVPSAPILPGMANEVNEHGVFVTSESVIVPVPKKAECVIRLACAADGRWACGYEFKLPSAGASGGPQAKDATHETRAAALDAALVAGRDFFSNTNNLSAGEVRLANRCCEAVVRFRDDFRAKLVDGTDVPAEPPTEQPRPAPVYRTEFADLPVAKIQENPTNNRKHFNPIKDRELADSLLSEGLHQPIAVRKLLDGETPDGELGVGDPGAPEYELIFGHRRRRAAIMAGIVTLQAKVYFGLTRKQATAIALIENLQRENINAMEESEGYAQLMADENLTQEQCAGRVGRPRSTVANALRLLRLPEVVRETIRDGLLTAEHGKALVRFVPDEKDREAFPDWEKVVKMMAEIAGAEKVTSAAMEKGVPFIHSLNNAGLAVRIDQFGVQRIGKQKDHPAYFPTGDGDWVCFAPKHWQAEVAARDQLAAEKAEKERLRREEEMAKLLKGGRRQLKLEDLDPGEYREFSPDQEALLSLVPDDKKTAAKGAGGRTTVVTDVQLADRLQKAMLRAIRKNRDAAVGALFPKVMKKIAGLKRVGPREFAWLVFLLTDYQGRQICPRLTSNAAKAAGAKLPGSKGLLDFDPNAWSSEERFARERGRLALLAKYEPVELLKTMMTDRVEQAIADVVENGPESIGGRMVKWWLDTDTLWLLEETEDGRAELVESVKASAWYSKMSAGESTEGEE